jgi:hypothetical protein
MKTPLYEQLVTNFCQTTGFDTPQALLAAGEVLVDDIAISLFFEPEIAADDLVLYSDIALRPHETDPLLLQHLLEANMFWSGTGGGTIGMHPETGRIGLATRLPVTEPDGQWLVQALYRFSTMTKFWRQFFEHHQAGLAKVF